jgi:N-formylmaleamate deformylase
MKPNHASLAIVERFACLAFLALAIPAVGPASGQSPQTSRAPFTFTVAGHGHPMILIPGLASSGATWAGTVQHLKQRYTCYVLTLAGFAGVPPIQPPFLSTVRDGIAAFIRRRHLVRAIIVGHSLGGSIALDLAAHDPSLVGPVVIVDSLPFYAGAWFHVKDLDQAKPIIAQIRQGMQSETRAQYLARTRSGAQVKYMVTSPKRLQEIIQWGLVSDPKTVNDALIELVSEDLRPELARITSPTLVLGTWKGLDEQLAQYHISLTRADFVKTFEDQYAQLPHLHFVMCDTARHFIMFDDPAWFDAQLDAFLNNPETAVGSRGFGGEGSDSSSSAASPAR